MTQLQNIGLLILRIGLGVSFIFHGLPKLAGGPQVWERIGAVMSVIGINVVPIFWGFMAALSEFGGGILLILGLITRFASGAMCFTMVVAASMHISRGDDFKVYSHAVEVGVCFLALIFLGAGKYSLDQKLLTRS